MEEKKLRIIGFIDTIIPVDAEFYNQLKQSNQLEKFVVEILSDAQIEITYGLEEEF